MYIESDLKSRNQTEETPIMMMPENCGNVQLAVARPTSPQPAFPRAMYAAITKYS